MNWILIIDDAFYTKTKSIVAQLRPKELVYDPLNTEKELLGIFQNSFIKCTLSKVHNHSNSWHPGFSETLSDQFKEIKKTISKEDAFLVFSAFSGLFNYLKSLLILEQVISGLRIKQLNLEMNQRMILDSQAL